MQSKVDDVYDAKKVCDSIDHEMRVLTGKITKLKSKRRWTIPRSKQEDDENFAEIPATRWKPRDQRQVLPRVHRHEDLLPAVMRIRAKLASLSSIRPRTDYSRVFETARLSKRISPEEFTAAVRSKLRITELAEPDEELSKFFRFIDKDGEGTIPVEDLVDFIQSAVDET